MCDSTSRTSNLIMLRHLILFLLLFAALGVTGQEYSTKSKKAIQYFKTANYHYRTGEYEEAETYLALALEKDANFYEANIFMAEVSAAQKKRTDAIRYFKKALEIDPASYPQIYVELGRLLMKENQYAEARRYLEEFKKFPVPNKDLQARAAQELSNAKFGEIAIQSPVPFDPKNMGPAINSKDPEYFPGLTTDENLILFTRLIKDSRLQSEFHSGFQEDFYIAKRIDNTWQQSRNLGGPINSLLNEGAPTLAADGQRIIFTACAFRGSYGRSRKGFGSCDLFETIRRGEKWSAPKNLGGKINSKHWESQPSFSADGKTLYFVRGINGKDGKKHQDIYFSTLDSNGQWSIAQRISNIINTPGREESVFIHPDGRTLYFSSDGHPGMGGLDIYVSRMNEKGEWTTPENLGYPINTGNDENSLLVSANGRIGYFASDRDGGFGDLDLYSFDLPEKSWANQVTYMKGKVFDKNTRDPLKAKFELIDLKTGTTVVQSFSNEGNGEFLVSLPINREYALNASRDGYIFYSENISFSENDALEGVVTNVPLSPLKEGAVFELRNVFFETAKFDLKNESKIELNRLVRILKGNPSIRLEVGGHTDNQGSETNNQILSENRAKAVVAYLAERGIAAERLTAVGYGQSKPKTTNYTEEGRAINRRTEFTVLSL